MIGEVKAIRHLAPIHEAQLPSYLRISGIKVSMLMNFRARVLKNGFKRIINEFPNSAFSASWAVKQ